MTSILPRHLTIALHRLAAQPEIVLLEGPRGSGKTVLLRNEFPRRHYITFDEPAARRESRRDPAAFLSRLRSAAVLDDVHRVPELVRYLAQTPEPRPIILAASRKLSLPVTTLRLYHPTRAELEQRPAVSLEMLGRFAPTAVASKRSVEGWQADYPSIERDFQDLLRFQDLDRFDTFVHNAREQSGRILDHQKLANLSGVSRTTAQRWLAVLEACFLTVRLPPCDYDFGRRLVQSPKLHFLDSPIFESRVVSEIYRNAVHTGATPDLRYWRDSNGFEVPLVLQPSGLPPMPVSIAELPSPTEEARLHRWMALAGVRNAAMISGRSREPRRGAVVRYSLNNL